MGHAYVENNKFAWGSFLKFVVGTLAGLLLVVIPLNFNGTVDTISFYFLKKFVAFAGSGLMLTIAIIVMLSGLISLYVLLAKPQKILSNKLGEFLFNTTPFYVINRLLGGIIALLCYFNAGPEFLISADTGGTMLSLSAQLSILIPPMLLFQTFILEFGAMEFVGSLVGFVFKPLFKISENAAVSVISAWVGPGNAAILGTRQLFEEGYYTVKEAAVIGSQFATSSIGWVVLIASVLDLMDVFWWLYLVITVVGFIIAMVIVRIPPVSKYPNTYVNGTTHSAVVENAQVIQGSRFLTASVRACRRVEGVSAQNFANKIKNMLFYVISLQPIIICWGTLALILSVYTPVLEWISYPVGYVLALFQVPQAYEAATAIMSGFADNYLPVILGKSLESPEVKFIVAAMSIIQLIFMSEIATLLKSTKIITKFKDIIIIFVLRTVLALPLVVLAAKWLF